MKKVLDYQSGIFLPIKACDVIQLCLKEEWRDKTINGSSLINATVVNSARELSGGGSSFFSKAHRWNSRAQEIVQYSFSIDDAQFKDDPETDEPYVISCSDIASINPYPCAVNAALIERPTLPPTILSATVPTGGTTLVLVLNQDVLPASLITGFTAKVGVTPNVITAANRTADRTITLTLTTTVLTGQTVTYSYAPGNVTDEDGNELQAITDAAVTNSSTQV